MLSKILVAHKYEKNYGKKTFFIVNNNSRICCIVGRKEDAQH